MNSTILALALAGTMTGQTAETPAWQINYAEAKTAGETQKKPLAVFLGSGEKGWDKVARDGGMNAQAQRLLTNQFVPVFIDSSTESGKQLAEAFSLPNGQGLVVSDRSGGYVAYRQQGDMTNADLIRQLERLSSTSRTSFYPSTGTIASSLMGYSAGSTLVSDCPNCSGTTAVSTGGGLRLFRR